MRAGRRGPQQRPAFLSEVGFLAQEMPLYRRMTAEDHIRVGAHLNPRWDGEPGPDAAARAGHPARPAGGTLSGGQRSQVALGLALAKRPRLLLLDEPVAALDPLARRHFLQTLTAAVAEAEGLDDGTTVLAPDRGHRAGLRPPDPARRVPGAALRGHRRPAGGAPDPGRPEEGHLGAGEGAHGGAGDDHWPAIDAAGPAQRALADPGWQAEDVSLEELVLGYMGATTPAYTSPKTVESAGEAS